MPLARIRELLDRTPDDALQELLDGLPPTSSTPSLFGLPPSLEPRRASSLDEVGPSSSRSQWERVVLEPGVELHIRRPLGIPANRRARRVIELYPTLVKE